MEGFEPVQEPARHEVTLSVLGPFILTLLLSVLKLFILTT